MALLPLPKLQQPCPRSSLPLLSLRAFRYLPSPPSSPPSPRMASLLLPSPPFAPCYSPASPSPLRRHNRSLHAVAVMSPFAVDVFVASSILDVYAECGLLADARQMFDGMPHRNVVSWSALICGYVDGGLNADALDEFKSALLDGVEVNDFTFSCVVRVSAASTLHDLRAQVHARAAKAGLVPVCRQYSHLDVSPFVGSILISMCPRLSAVLSSRCVPVCRQCSHLAEHAYQVFEEMPERNLGAWNAVLITSAQHGHTMAAFERFEDTKAAGFRLIILHSSTVETDGDWCMMQTTGLSTSDASLIVG